MNSQSTSSVTVILHAVRIARHTTAPADLGLPIFTDSRGGVMLNTTRVRRAMRAQFKHDIFWGIYYEDEPEAFDLPYLREGYEEVPFDMSMLESE